MSARLDILAVEPYFGLSHRAFLEGYARYSRHRVRLWTLPPRKWKWRMRGSAYYFAHLARETTDPPPDVVFASDYLNLADWKALAPPPYARRPAVLYFHENQIAYPLSARAPVEYHYGWINLSSALTADRVLFNSHYHRRVFLAGVRHVLRRMPDAVPEELVVELESKSEMFPVGIDFALHDGVLRDAGGCLRGQPPLIVWNHRWEYDKDPETFARAVREIAARGVPFRLALCGEDFGRPPPVFSELKACLGPRLVQFGFVPDPKNYLRLLAGAEIVASTARHEFFGVSVVEALYMGCLPALPHDLSYPELVPPHLHSVFLYPDRSQLGDFLERLLTAPPREHREELRRAAARFDWRRLAPALDGILEEVRTAWAEAGT